MSKASLILEMLNESGLDNSSKKLNGLLKKLFPIIQRLGFNKDQGKDISSDLDYIKKVVLDIKDNYVEDGYGLSHEIQKWLFGNTTSLPISKDSIFNSLKFKLSKYIEV